MERYRDIKLEMPGADAMPAWALGGVDSDTEDLAAWLRDTGSEGTSGTFSSDIDASWLGAGPTSEDLAGGAEAPAADDKPLEAGA